MESKAQLTLADSNYLADVCVDATYIDIINFPGNWFVFNEIGSINDFYDQIEKSYPFTNNQLLSSYDSIEILGGGIYLDNILNQQIQNYNSTYNADLFLSSNPFIKLDFKAFGKTTRTYALLDSIDVEPQNRKIAFVVLSGTGPNQLTSLSVNGNNYHNTNCFVRKHL